MRNISGGEEFPCYLIRTIETEGTQQVETAGALRDEKNARPDHSPELVVIQKRDSGYYGTKRQSDGAFLIYMTMLIANQSDKGNSVIAYSAEIMRTDGTYESLKIEQGKTPDFEFCITPLNIPAYSTVETVLAFISVNPAKYGQPFKMNISAIDVKAREFTGAVQF
ncbi:MAG TPA: hypothetical protein VIJ01_17200 [Candidatus Angelobacter sp.]